MALTQSIPVITIDGPSGVGKGTLARQLADALHFHQLDSGAIYRLCALYAIEEGLDCGSEATANQVIASIKVKFEQGKVFLNGRDVTTAIREEMVGESASKIAKFPQLRKKMSGYMQTFRQAPGLIADGRDMGTAVFPDADLKIFLNASAKERAARRYNQLKEKGIDVSMSDIFFDLNSRDLRDKEREADPLVPASEAVLLDSTSLNASEVFNQVMALVDERKLNQRR